MKPEKYFFKIKDDEYQKFTSKLLPTIPSDSVIGVRLPDIKKFAKEYIKDEECKEFLNSLPHKYLEENILHAQLISLNKNFDEVVDLLDKFLPYVDNWSVCDTIKPIAVKKHPKEFLKYIRKWIKSKQEYRVRSSIVMLLTFYLNENFTDEINELVVNVISDKYYINMARAWYFSFALVKQYDRTIHIFKDKLLDEWTNNKSIQKARESFRINTLQKEELLKYKM